MSLRPITMPMVAGWVRQWVGALFLRNKGNQTLDGSLTITGNASVTGNAAITGNVSAANATATPTADAIIKADGDGKIGAGWIDEADISYNNISDVPATFTPSSHTHATLTAPVTFEQAGNGWGWLFSGNNGHSGTWAHGSISGTAIDLVSETEPDAKYLVVYGMYALMELDGGAATTNTAVGAISLDSSAGADTQDLCNFTGRICRLTLASNGNLSIQRASGARTYRVSLTINWTEAT